MLISDALIVVVLTLFVFQNAFTSRKNSAIEQAKYLTNYNAMFE